jgi:hypothetical protein
MTSEQMSILEHTQRNGRFCGDSPDMQALVAAGLMVSLGKASWCPDEFFGLTNQGREFLRTGEASDPYDVPGDDVVFEPTEAARRGDLLELANP